MEERISKKQLMELYGVNRNTIEEWRRTKGLKMIQITSHSKYILKNDLIEWENSLKPKDRVMRFNKDEVSK